MTRVCFLWYVVKCVPVMLPKSIEQGSLALLMASFGGCRRNDILTDSVMKNMLLLLQTSDLSF